MQYDISKMGWFGIVRGHARLLKITSFDRMHTDFCLPSVVTMSYLVPFLRYSKILVENHRF